MSNGHTEKLNKSHQPMTNTNATIAATYLNSNAVAYNHANRTSMRQNNKKEPANTNYENFKNNNQELNQKDDPKFIAHSNSNSRVNKVDFNNSSGNNMKLHINNLTQNLNQNLNPLESDNQKKRDRSLGSTVKKNKSLSAGKKKGNLIMSVNNGLSLAANNYTTMRATSLSKDKDKKRRTNNLATNGDRSTSKDNNLNGIISVNSFSNMNGQNFNSTMP